MVQYIVLDVVGPGLAPVRVCMCTEKRVGDDSPMRHLLYFDDVSSQHVFGSHVLFSHQEPD